MVSNKIRREGHGIIIRDAYGSREDQYLQRVISNCLAADFTDSIDHAKLFITKEEAKKAIERLEKSD